MPQALQINIEYARPLTPTQLITLKAIWYYYARHQIAPTMDEVAQMLGKRNAASIQRVVDSLRNKGYLLKLDTKRIPRSLVPIATVEDAERIIQSRTPVMPDRFC